MMRIKSYKELRVFQSAMDLCMDIFSLTKGLPVEEKFALADQIKRSSRSVCSNLAEAWHKRRYRAAFIAKLNDAEGEASETQVWLELARRCKYLADEKADQLDSAYDQVVAQLVNMIQNADQWVIDGTVAANTPGRQVSAPKGPLSRRSPVSRKSLSPTPPLSPSPPRAV